MASMRRAALGQASTPSSTTNKNVENHRITRTAPDCERLLPFCRLVVVGSCRRSSPRGTAAKIGVINPEGNGRAAFFAAAVSDCGVPDRPGYDKVRSPMLYAVLCYNFEDAVGAWTPAEDVVVMERLGKVEAGLAADDRLGAVARLLPTTAAVTLRKGRPEGGREQMVIDGPFAETKEQLLGFYVVDCGDLEAAIAVARDLAAANPDRGAYEIRPLAVYRPGRLTEARVKRARMKEAGA
jgi:hypothetical protein